MPVDLKVGLFVTASGCEMNVGVSKWAARQLDFEPNWDIGSVSA